MTRNTRRVDHNRAKLLRDYLTLDILSRVQCTECDWTGPFSTDGMRAVMCRQCGAELDPDSVAGAETHEALGWDAVDAARPARYGKRANRLTLRGSVRR